MSFAGLFCLILYSMLCPCGYKDGCHIHCGYVGSRYRCHL
jgi:hypothetical protein